MKRIEKEFNALTNEETIIERDETEQEAEDRAAAEEAAQAEHKTMAQRNSDRAALLAQLGITEEQAKLLVG